MMATITIRNDVRGHIEGDFDDKALDEHLAFRKSSFWWKSQAARSHMWDGKTRLYYRHSGTFPLGLLRDIRSWLKKEGVKVRVIDERTSEPLERGKIVKKLGGGITLRRDQRRAIYRAVQKERGIIHGATGAGKTELAIGITKTLGNPVTLFLTGRKKLARQTRERFALRLGVPVEDIGLIMSGEWHHGESGIYVAVVDSLTQEKFKRERKILYDHCELLFVDEAHHAGSTTWYRTLMNCKARNRYGLTGTPVGRSDGGDLYLRACTGDVIARTTARELIEKGVLAEPKIIFTKVRRPKIIDGDWQSVYSRGITANKTRNKIIVNYALDLERLGKRVLILVREIEHGKTLVNSLEMEGSKSVFVHGGTPDNVLDATVKKFDLGKNLNVLIATSIFDEGLDVPSIDAVILSAGGKSEITTLQRIGRGLRRKIHDNRLFVFDFYDETHRHLHDHADRRVSICEQAGYKVVVLDRPGEVDTLVA